MPEYRAVRKQHSLLEICKKPALAAEVTITAAEILEIDAAIIFADLLLPLEVMGLPFHFSAGEGPVIEKPVRSKEDIANLRTDRAAELGVRAVPLGGGAQFYFGLAGTNSTDGHGSIEFFDPNKEQFLEYDVVKLIYQLANPKKPSVAWWSSLPMGAGFDPQSGQTREPWVVYSNAQQLYDVILAEACRVEDMIMAPGTPGSARSTAPAAAVERH